MSREGRTAGEGLLAIGVWAFVWSLSRVDAAMAGERTAIGEWLLLQSVSVKGTWCGMLYLSTTLTHVRLLASVHTRVHCQRRALNELLATAWVITDVWPYTAVDALCDLTLAPLLPRDET